MRKLRAQEPGGMLQRLHRIGSLRGTGEMGEEYLGMRQIRRDFDAGHGDHADPRILHVQAQKIGELTLDLIADAMRPLGVLLHRWAPVSSRRSASMRRRITMRREIERALIAAMPRAALAPPL